MKLIDQQKKVMILLVACMTVSISLAAQDQHAAQIQETAVIRLAFHHVFPSSAMTENAAEEIANFYQIIQDQFINGSIPIDPPYPLGTFEGIDKLRNFIVPGVNDWFYGSGIQFENTDTQQLVLEDGIATSGYASLYRQMFTQHNLQDRVNVYLLPVPTLYDGNGKSFRGIAFKDEKTVLLAIGGTLSADGALFLFSDLDGKHLTHELGHILGLPHTRSGVMWSFVPPVVTLTDDPVLHGGFTPSQIQMMWANLPQYAVENDLNSDEEFTINSGDDYTDKSSGCFLSLLSLAL